MFSIVSTGLSQTRSISVIALVSSASRCNSVVSTCLTARALSAGRTSRANLVASRERASSRVRPRSWQLLEGRERGPVGTAYPADPRSAAARGSRCSPRPLTATPCLASPPRPGLPSCGASRSGLLSNSRRATVATDESQTARRAGQPHAGRSVAGFFYSSVNLATEAMLQIEGVEGLKVRGLTESQSAEKRA